MALFDSVISGAQEKFNVNGDKAGSLLSTLLGAIFDEENGGFSGFLERFKEVGLEDTVTSWINTGANTPLSNEQTESVFGEGTLKDISDEVGLDYDTTTSATAFMVPHIVDNLTPDGEVPDESSLMTTIGGYLAGIGGAIAGVAGDAKASVAETAGNISDAAKGAFSDDNAADGIADDIGDAPAAVAPREGSSFEVSPDTIIEEGGSGSILKWLIPLILLALLVFILYMSCGNAPTKPVARSNTNSAVNSATNSNSSSNTTTNAEGVDSSFKLEAMNGKYIVSGVINNEATKKEIMNALIGQYGEANVVFAGLNVDTKAKPFADGWWENFSKLLPSLKDWKLGKIGFAGNSLTTAEGLPEAATAQIKTLYGKGWNIPVSILGEEDAAKRANEEALEELGAAKSVEEVVKAMNASIINFASGSSAIPADAKPVLDKAAEVLKAQPENTKIEIGGYTDSDGDDTSNQKLSEARANSVKSELVKLGVAEAMLTAKGYGEANPVAGNDTPDNKFKNRRIEYKVMPSGNSMP